MKKTISLTLVLVLDLAMAGLAQAATVAVGLSGGCDFDTIQAGIDAANDADTVLVAPGEYVITEPITFRGKAITVKAEAGRDQTTIRMGTPADTNRGSVVVFENNETEMSVLEGFTITGGRGVWLWISSESNIHWFGGGICFNASSGKVRNCAIVQNRTKDAGGGVFCRQASATLTNCIISGNSATGEVGGGAGLGCWDNSTVTLTNCTVEDNSAAYVGGGVLCWKNSSMTMTDCIISRNSTTEDSGGGMECWENSSATLTNCTIAENLAGRSGGGVFCGQYSSMTVTGCIIRDNSCIATQLAGGGGVQCYLNSSLTMTDCLIAQNSSGCVGGGVFCSDNAASVTVTNCVIVGNTARWGGGLAGWKPASTSVINCTIWGNSAKIDGGGVGCYNGASATVTNSILWANTAPVGSEIMMRDSAPTLTITYSDVDGGEARAVVRGGSTLNWGAGNIDTDPCFACIGYWDDNGTRDTSDDVWVDGDFHLKSQAGRRDSDGQTWVQDDVTSPCIDAGDPNHPVGDEPEPNGDQINMGAYGGTSEASMSTRPQPTPQPVAHWKLDEEAGTIAYDSAGQSDAFLMGDPVWQPDAGKVGGALALDGVDDWAFTSPVPDLGAGPVSVFAWIKGGGPGQVVISQPLVAGWLMADNEGRVMTELGDASPSGGSLVSEVVITDGDWYQIGVVLDGVHRRLYVDGVMVAEDSQAGSEASASGFNIGVGKDYLPETHWSGMLDDIRIYNWAIIS